jgi:hypothetical protein
MAHTRRTLKLSAQWDIELDAIGRIRVAEKADATAQNVANEVRLFKNDAYFAWDRGIPYFTQPLGHTLSETVLTAHVQKAALRVEDVGEIMKIEINNFDLETRILHGEIRFKTRVNEDGEQQTYF